MMQKKIPHFCGIMSLWSCWSLPVMPSLLPHVLWGRSQVSQFFANVMSPAIDIFQNIDASLLPTIYWPSFAIHDHTLVHRTVDKILRRLKGKFGIKRFLRDGYRTVVEDRNRSFYRPAEIKVSSCNVSWVATKSKSFAWLREGMHQIWGFCMWSPVSCNRFSPNLTRLHSVGRKINSPDDFWVHRYKIKFTFTLSKMFLLLLISPHYRKCLTSQFLSNVVLLGNYKMKNKKYDTIKIFLKSNTKMIETEVKSIPLTHIYMTGQFPGLVQALQYP